jgi:hypothetical protein
MYKKEVTYTDFEDNTRVETCLFNLSEAELTDLQLGPKDGLAEYMQSVMADIDNRREEVLDFIKKIILKAYGVRREIGGKVLFTKTEDDKLLFQYGGAFDAVYMDFLRNPQEIYTFMTAAAPAQYRARLQKAQQDGTLPTVEQIEENPTKAFEVVQNAENSNS